MNKSFKESGKPITFSVIIISAIVIFMLAAGCRKSDTVHNSNPLDNQPYVPPALETAFDINNDSVTDFKTGAQIICTDDDPVSSCSEIFSIIPLNGNELLYKEYDGHFFLKKNDTLFSSYSSNSPFTWDNYKADIMDRAVLIDKDTIWTLNNPLKLNDLYIPFKFLKNDSLYLGWMKIDVNLKTSEIKVIASKFTTNDFIVIDE